MSFGGLVMVREGAWAVTCAETGGGRACCIRCLKGCVAGLVRCWGHSGVVGVAGFRFRV